MTYYGWLTEGSAFAKKPLLGKRSRDYVLEALKGVEIIESRSSFPASGQIWSSFFGRICPASRWKTATS